MKRCRIGTGPDRGVVPRPRPRADKTPSPPDSRGASRRRPRAREVLPDAALRPIQDQRVAFGEEGVCGDDEILDAFRGDADALAVADNGVVIDMGASQGKVVVAQGDRGLARVGVSEKEIVMNADAARGLEEGLARIVPENIAVDLVEVVGSGTARGEAADKHVGTVSVGTRGAVLDEHIVTDEGAAGGFRHPGDRHARVLELDLHAIADGILDEVVFDDPADEGIGPVRVAEVKAGAAAADDIAPDRPVPRRRLRGNADRLLRSVPVADEAVLDEDVMNPVLRPTLRADAEDPRRASRSFAENREALQRDMAAVAEFDAIRHLCLANLRYTGFRTFDGDPRVRRAVAVSDGQSPFVNPASSRRVSPARRVVSRRR